MVYLIHFNQPYKHARHYLGFTDDLEARLSQHAHGNGARLMAVIHAAGITWQLARTWEGDRKRERRLKHQHHSARLCPLCNPRAYMREKG